MRNACTCDTKLDPFCPEHGWKVRKSDQHPLTSDEMRYGEGCECPELRAEVERLREAVQWLLGSDTGLSSESILAAAAGVEREHDLFNGQEYPSDPADLGRCLRLIARCPWTEGAVATLAEKNPVWRAYMKRWTELRSTMEIEVGIDWSKGDFAPATYKIMCAIRKAAEAAEKT